MYNNTDLAVLTHESLLIYNIVFPIPQYTAHFTSFLLKQGNYIHINSTMCLELKI